MGFWEKLGIGKKEDSKASRLRRAGELHGKAIRYVTERVEENDNVVGRGGSISLRNGEVILFSSDRILLRVDAEKLSASYLLSGDGVILSGPNKEKDGCLCTYTAYFVYYRK